jgi:hypothetical protein
VSNTKSHVFTWYQSRFQAAEVFSGVLTAMMTNPHLLCSSTVTHCCGCTQPSPSSTCYSRCTACGDTLPRCTTKRTTWWVPSRLRSLNILLLALRSHCTRPSREGVADVWGTRSDCPTDPSDVSQLLTQATELMERIHPQCISRATRAKSMRSVDGRVPCERSVTEAGPPRAELCCLIGNHSPVPPVSL